MKVFSGSEQDGQHKTLEREGWDSLDICRREMVNLLDKGEYEAEGRTKGEDHKENSWMY